MVEGYEWVFFISFASVAFGGLMAVYEVYLTISDRRSRREDAPDRSHPRPKYPARPLRRSQS